MPRRTEHPPAATEPTGPAHAGALRSARRLSALKGRRASGQFLAEGPQAVREAVAARVVARLFVTASGAERHGEIVQDAANSGVTVLLVSDEELASLTDTVTPQGLVAVCRATSASLADVLARSPRLVVVCAQVRDPGNAGTVIRCADAFGADAVVLTQGSVDVHNPKAVRASVGSIFHLPVVEDVPLLEVTEALKAAGLTVVAADGSEARHRLLLLEVPRPEERSGARGVDALGGELGYPRRVRLPHRAQGQRPALDAEAEGREDVDEVHGREPTRCLGHEAPHFPPGRVRVRRSASEARAGRAHASPQR
ncbi:MAG TPA: RNA methyltransferase [Propionibacteriaceae bacterium]|nr:RNA methyltransferase [Propionibacteriaceae bacterium]